MTVVLTGCVLSFLTITIHAIGTLTGISLLRKHAPQKERSLSNWKMIVILWFVGLFLLILHFAEAICWAVCFYVVPETGIQTFEEAMYFSMVTSTTLGYGDVIVESPYRLLAGIEAMNGLLIFGWSTAMFLQVLRRLWLRMEESSQ